MDPDDCLLDTNILLRISRPADPAYLAVQQAFTDLKNRGVQLFYSLQTVAEFWNVATRPLTQNGYGLPQDKAYSLVQTIEGLLTLLPEDPRVYAVWRALVIQHQVKGRQVHDARLAALMQVHGTGSILTLNPADFRRYPGITVIVPGNF